MQRPAFKASPNLFFPCVSSFISFARCGSGSCGLEIMEFLYTLTHKTGNLSIIFLKHSSASFRMQSAHQQWWLTPLPALLAPGHVSGMEGSSGEVCGGKQLIPHSLSIPKDGCSLEWFVKSTAMLTRLAECKQLRRQSCKICNFKSERSGSGTWKEVHLDKVKPSRSWNPPKRWWWSW